MGDGMIYGCDAAGNVYINGKQCAGQAIDNLTSNLHCIDSSGGYTCKTINTSWSTPEYGITFDSKYIEAMVKEVVNKLHDKSVELYDGPEIPKWNGFINI